MHNIMTRLANQRVGDSRCFSFKPQIRQPPRRPFRREHLSLFASPHPLPLSLAACIRHNGRRSKFFGEIAYIRAQWLTAGSLCSSSLLLSTSMSPLSPSSADDIGRCFAGFTNNRVFNDI